VFSSSSTPGGIADVVSGTVTMATINPPAALTVAFRGNGPFGAPQPVRTIAVIPSFRRANAADAPFDVPLHPAAERFRRSRGYI
jgi:hypothetical protein